MGRRGINAKPKRAPGEGSLPGPHPWESPSLSRAERVITFIETLPVTAGPLAGTLLKLRPWQKRFVRAIYRTDKAGNRLIRTAVLSVARKNGKTKLASCLALAHLVGPESESRGEVLLGGLHPLSGRPRLQRDGGDHHRDAVAAASASTSSALARSSKTT